MIRRVTDPSSPAPIDIDTAVDADRAVVTVRGELDLLSAPTLTEHLEGLDPGVTTLELDLSDLSFVDSSGLNALLAARRRLDEAGGELRVTKASDVALRLFDVAGVRELLGPTA
jgi:anti-sigma B factor antagonist